MSFMPFCTTSTETLKTQLNNKYTHNTHKLKDKDSNPNKAEWATKYKKKKVNPTGVEFQNGSNKLERLKHDLQIRVNAYIAP